MKTTQTFSILIWASRLKNSKEEAIISARITVDGKRAEISLKKKINPNFWDSKAGHVSAKCKDAQTINGYIDQVKSKLFKLYTQMQMLDEVITAESLKLKFTGKKEEMKSLLQVFDFHNDEMRKSIGVNIERVTLTKYLTVRKKVIGIFYQWKR